VNHFHPVRKPVVFSVSLILFYKNTTRHPPGKTEVWKESGDRAPWNGEKKLRAGVQLSTFPERVGAI